MNLESKVPSVQELEDHFRAQAKWKGPPPGYWIVDQKGKGEKVEPKIELVSHRSRIEKSGITSQANEEKGSTHAP